MVRGFDDENRIEEIREQEGDSTIDSSDGIISEDFQNNENLQAHVEISQDTVLPDKRSKNPISNFSFDKIKDKPIIMLVIISFFALLAVWIFSLYCYSTSKDVKWIVLMICSAVLWILFAITGYFIDKTLATIEAQKILQEAQNKKYDGLDVQKSKNKIILYSVGIVFACFLVGMILYPRFVANPDNASQEAMLMAKRQREGLNNLKSEDGVAPADFAQQTDGMEVKDPKVVVNVDDVSGNPQAGGIDVMAEKGGNSFYKGQKRVAISVDGSQRSNPFMPAGESGGYSGGGLPPLDLVTPPDTVPQNTDATKIMTTTISGIMYDKYNPSAIININNSDYLVKRGDVINSYRILAIGPNQVTVRLGNNVYRAGVGELLKRDEINYNNIDHLNRKFGGNNDVSISVRRRSY